MIDWTKPVQDRNGARAKVLLEDDGNGNVIVAVYSTDAGAWRAYTVDRNGYYRADSTTAVIANVPEPPEIKRSWHVVHRGTIRPVLSEAYADRDSADRVARGPGYVGIVQLETIIYPEDQIVVRQIDET